METKQRKSKFPWLLKIGLALWICVMVNIMAQIIYLHFTPWTSSEIHSVPPPSMSSLKLFYSDINLNNTYLNPININNESVVYQLLQRILTQNSNNKTPKTPLINSIVSRFNFSIVASSALCKSSDIEFGCYKILQNNKHDIIYVYGNNIASIISGLSYYLSTYWMVSLSWNGNNIKCIMDEEYLQLVTDNTPNAISHYASRSFEWTYYKNPCTDSYSMVWWDWNRWEQELDWMVLQNINLLLLPTLNEVIEYELYTTHFGLSIDELSTYFVGPAFLAWFRMGNLQGWPPYYRDGHRRVGLTQHWLKQQLILSYKVIARCIELGIDIILSGFSGHVPTALTKHIDGTFYDGSRWFGMPAELTHLKFLDATDDLYVKIGLKYQRIQYDIISSFLEMKGQQTIFLWLDQFNELTPSSSELQYLQKSGENQLKSLQLKEYSDRTVKVKWIIQGWMFVHLRSFWSNQRIKHYFGGIGGDDILILDLIAEKSSIAKDSDHFFGHDYIWCFLHNFGGGYGLSGNLQNIFNTLSNHIPNEYWKGIGISMEGIHNNPMLYHAVLYHSFMLQNENKMDTFVRKYVSSRYGKQIFDANDEEILQIWKSLHPLIYASSQGKWSVTKSLVAKKPRNNIVSGPSEFEWVHGNRLKYKQRDKQTAKGFQTTLVDYTLCKLFVIWERLILFTDGLIKDDEYMDIVYKSETLANDIAEITRELLSHLFQEMYLLLNKDTMLEDMMLSVIDDIDEILSDFTYFRLDEWINNARSFGQDKEEKDYLEWNARNLVTRWGPNGEINDYSSREWNGLMSNYYKMRWKRFFDGDNINIFEKNWQKKTIQSIQNINKNTYQITHNFEHFYSKIFGIYTKYNATIDCTV